MRCFECNKEMKNGWDESKQPGDLVRHASTKKCSECVWARRRLNNVDKLRVIRSTGCICPSCKSDYSRDLPGALLYRFMKVSIHQPKCQWEEPVKYFYECRRCSKVRGKQCLEWISPTDFRVLDCSPVVKARNYNYEDGFTRGDFNKKAEPLE
jgi:hypothetical protein